MPLKAYSCPTAASDVSSYCQDLDLSEWGVGALAADRDEKVPEISEETSRLAILDLDWTKVRGSAGCRSFATLLDADPKLPCEGQAYRVYIKHTKS